MSLYAGLGPKTLWSVHQLGLPNVGGLVVDHSLLQFSSRRYLRSKSKVVRNRAEFWKFFALPNSVGAGLAKVVSK